MIYDIAKMMADTGCSADAACAQACESMSRGNPIVPSFGSLQSDGGTLYFPAGRYDLTQKLTVPRHCHVRGDGDASVLVWANGAGMAFQAFPDLNYANFSSIERITLVNDAPARAMPDPVDPARYIGIDIQGGASQLVDHVWSIGWETHIRGSQIEHVTGSHLRMFGRTQDALAKTYGLHLLTLPGRIADATNYNWFDRISFNGPYHPYVHDDGKGNVLSKFHVNASGPMLVRGACLTIEHGSFEGGPSDEDAHIVTGGAGTVPFYQLRLLSLRCDAGDKHLFRLDGGSPYGLTVENCHTLSSTHALISNQAFLQGPVILLGNQAWGIAPVWEGNDANWDQCVLAANSWFGATGASAYQRSGIGVGTILPTQKLTIKDP